MDSKTLFHQVKEAGIPFDNHCSDLYIPVNMKTQKLVAEYEFKQNVTTFSSAIDKTPWFDIPFAYDPYWESRGFTS